MSGSYIEEKNLHSDWIKEERETRKDKWAVSFFAIIFQRVLDMVFGYRIFRIAHFWDGVLVF